MSSFIIQHQKQKAALVRQLNELDPSRVRKISAFTETEDTQKTLRVAAYCRVSTDDIDQAISIELQMRQYKEKIQSNPNYKYVGTYVDNGFSGTNTAHRPGFLKLIEDVRAGKIDMIITKAVSRFARNLLDCIGYIEELKNREPPVRVFFEQENLDTGSQTSNIILFVLAMVAEEESHMKSEAMLLSLEWRFSRGRFLTPALFGYDKVEIADTYGGKRIILQINQPQAQVVKWIYAMLLSGASSEEIAAVLTELKIPTGGRKRNGAVNTDSISQIMTSKTPARKCEDVDQQALTYSEIKALCTGDERIKEKLMLENDVKELRVLAAEHRNTVFEMEDRVARFPEQEQRLTAILNDLHTDREALRKLPIDPERKLPVFKITIGETEFTDRKEAAKVLEDAVLAIKYADTPVKVGSFQGFDLTVTVNSNMMGGGMSVCLKGAASHTTKLIESFAHNLNRLEAALYNIDGRIERTQADLAKLRLDHEEAKKIVTEPFPQQEELDSKEERLKVLTDELNQAAIEAKKNAPKRDKTCYFERAKMKRDAARLAKKPRTPKDKPKSKDKKQGIE